MTDVHLIIHEMWHFGRSHCWRRLEPTAGSARHCDVRTSRRPHIEVAAGRDGAPRRDSRRIDHRLVDHDGAARHVQVACQGDGRLHTHTGQPHRLSTTHTLKVKASAWYWSGTLMYTRGRWVTYPRHDALGVELRVPAFDCACETSMEHQESRPSVMAHDNCWGLFRTGKQGNTDTHLRE